MADKEKIIEIFSELRNFADNDVHPVVSPKNWDVYSKLRDLIDQAEEEVITLLKEQEPKPVGKEWNECPNCGKVLSSIEHIHFCGMCGQAVKWE